MEGQGGKELVYSVCCCHGIRYAVVRWRFFVVAIRCPAPIVAVLDLQILLVCTETGHWLQLLGEMKVFSEGHV